MITSGDSGIGAATAIAFAREGADVAISYLPEEKPDLTRAKLVRTVWPELGQDGSFVVG